MDVHIVVNAVLTVSQRIVRALARRPTVPDSLLDDPHSVRIAAVGDIRHLRDGVLTPFLCIHHSN